MAGGREDTTSKLGCSWLPTTPAKPDSTKQHPICTNWQENDYPVQANSFDPKIITRVSQAKWSESGSLVEDFLQEAHCQREYSCYGSKNPDNISCSDVNTWQRGETANSRIHGDYSHNFDTWQAHEGANSHVHGGDLSIYDKFSLHDTDKWTNMSFGDLLALAQGGGSTTAENVVAAPNDFVATGSTSTSRFHPQIEGSQYKMMYGSTLPPNIQSLLGAEFEAGLDDAPNIITDGSSMPSRPFFDLNAPLTDATSSKSLSFQFEPITPEKTNKTECKPGSVVPDLIIDEVPSGKDKQKQSQLATTTQLEENHKPDKGGIDADLSKTPQQKPRRRKHRPKVIIEGQRKTTPKPTPEKQPTGQPRKYTRRKGVEDPTNTPPLDVETDSQKNNTPTTSEGKRKRVRRKVFDVHGDTIEKGTPETADIKTTLRTRSSCRRSLNFDLEDEVTENPDGQWLPKSPIDSTCSSTCLTPERQARGLKRQHMVGTSAESDLCNKNATGTFHNSLQAYNFIFSQNAENNGGRPGMHFPAIYKKMRTQKVHKKLGNSCQEQFASRANQGSSVAQCKGTNLLGNNPVTDGIRIQNAGQIFESLLALGPAKRIRKKRSNGPTRLRDLASLVEFCKGATSSRIKQRIEFIDEPHTCMEALAADTRSTMTTKKRSKRNMLITSPMENMYTRHEFASRLMGPPLAITWRCVSPVESITDQLNKLDLSAESSQVSAQRQNAFLAYHMNYQEPAALVPYRRAGAVVPFDSSFDRVKRRRPRPKVDLDDETTKVWRLLLENINSDGIDGTDEEKVKYWEEERGVFSGRADSFIARMHLVQGDRRFSPWKGSVIDSVVGVFLTQNVSDHLSSSAFMSLAARFPHQSETNPEDLEKERVGSPNEEPEVYVLEPEETFDLNIEVLNKPVCGEDAEMLQTFEYAGNKSMSLTGSGGDIDDALSQISVISSQNSADSPIAQNTERSESCLLSTSEEKPTSGVEPNRFASSTSFVKLLQMAGTVLHGVYEKGSEKMSDKHEQVQSERLALYSQNEDGSEDPSFLAKPVISCSRSTSCLDPGLGEQATECFVLSQKNSKFSDTSSGGVCTARISGLSSESESRTTFQKFTAVSFEEGQNSLPNAHSSNDEEIETNQKIVGKRTGQETNYKMQEMSNISNPLEDLMDVTGSSRNSDNSRKSRQKEVKPNSKDPDYNPGKAVNGPKARGRRIGKEKQNPVDWNDLRKQAQADGTKRERPANTMDSVDWDAVRCAEVNEIAQTIKERGMNNVLAERIKDFLNRLVRDHGSIDLEWLRNVPPDKAKEYLLSFRGLGLKSVECVRLLTLHQLAFPVDTNVARIAVRLGWVPLQPLPESLQLHLLELYPILETIQQYLWPRLCKLDQRTLYELHYQMITFGKVFCTKSKPNCNACPMRGECRHFASAFASARLSLPAPEEKGIVSATENKAADQNPMRSMNTLQLPSPQANRVDAESGASTSQPIIEEPSTPEPIIEVPASPEPQVLECDIENALYEDPDEIPTIKLNMEEFTHNLEKIMQQNSELHEGDMSKALVALTREAASIPVPKLKNMNRLRTEHQVYELPDSHPLLEGMDKREPDDPSPYLLAIWTPGETVDSIEPPERMCTSQASEKLCTDEKCLSCNSIREANSQTVRGTLLIPCRTAMRGSFPLNGTYFQVNEVFSDHESSLAPMDVPRQWLWNLPRRTVFFGTSIPTIFKGLSTEGIQYCFWRGFVCVRGFDRKTRAPRPLIARLHFPASKLANKGKGKTDEN